MNEQNIQIVKLGPLRTASISAFGVFPKKTALRKLVAWAGLKGLLDNRIEHAIFGFRKSYPSRPGAKFGYEVWIKIGYEIEQERQMQVIDFPGGPYAVTRCIAQCFDDKRIIREWYNLEKWCKNNKFKPGYHQMLEKFITFDESLENLILDLYYPINY